MLEDIVKKTRKALLPILTLGMLYAPRPALADDAQRHVSIGAGLTNPTEDIGVVYPAGMQYSLSFSQNFPQGNSNKKGPLTGELEVSRFQSTAESKGSGASSFFSESNSSSSRDVVIYDIGLNLLLNAGSFSIGAGFVGESVELNESQYAQSRGFFNYGSSSFSNEITNLPFIGGQFIIDSRIPVGETYDLGVRAGYKQTQLQRHTDGLKTNGAYFISAHVIFGIPDNAKHKSPRNRRR